MNMEAQKDAFAQLFTSLELILSAGSGMVALVDPTQGPKIIAASFTTVMNTYN
jgi:hypothetical protein